MIAKDTGRMGRDNRDGIMYFDSLYESWVMSEPAIKECSIS